MPSQRTVRDHLCSRSTRLASPPAFTASSPAFTASRNILGLVGRFAPFLLRLGRIRGVLDAFGRELASFAKQRTAGDVGAPGGRRVASQGVIQVDIDVAHRRNDEIRLVIQVQISNGKRLHGFHHLRKREAERLAELLVAPVG